MGLLRRRRRARATLASPRHPLGHAAGYAIECLERRVLLAAVSWTGAAGDNQWTTPANWSTNGLPGPGDDVTINAAGSPAITLGSGVQSIRSLSSSDPLTIGSGGSLAVGTSAQFSADLTVSGGSLQGGTYSGTGSARLVLDGSVVSPATLAGVTISAGTIVDATRLNNDLVFVTGGLTLNGTMKVGSADASTSAIVAFPGTQTLAGAGTVVLGGSSVNALYAYGVGQTMPAALTIGGGITIHGGGGLVAGYSATDSLTNIGTITADTPGPGIVMSGAVTNTGTLSAGSGDTLTITNLQNEAGGDVTGNGGAISLKGNWNNAGTINLTNAALNLNGTFSLATLGNLTAGGSSVVNVTGTLNNTATTLALTSTTGTWNLNGGTINGGTITESGGSVLTIDGSPSPAALAGVTVAAGATVYAHNEVSITNGLTLNGALNLDATSTFASGFLQFQGTQTLTGTGTVLLSHLSAGVLAQGDGGAHPATLTIASGITIHGGSGIIGGENPNDSVVNEGNIQADSSSGGEVIVENFQNAPGGTLAATAGGQLTLSSNWNNAGVISVTGATVNLGGIFTLASLGTLNRSGGTVNVTGTLDNTNTTLALGPSTGGWVLAGGTIKGGTVAGSGAGTLSLASFAGTASTLDGVTIAAGTTVIATPSSLTQVSDGLTLNGTLDLGAADGSSYAGLIFQGTQTLSGTGTVLLGGSFQNSLQAKGSNNGLTPATLTIGSGIMIHGGGAMIGGYFASDTVVNDGTINSDAGGATITVGSNNTTPFTNNGTLEATTGTLDLGIRPGFNGNSPWVNNGTLALLGGTLNLDGSFTTGGIGTFSRPSDQGTVNLAGFLNNTGATLALTPSTGSWNLAGGTITGGAIADTPGVLLILTSLNGNGSALSGVTIAAGSTFDASENDAQVGVIGGLTLNGTIDLGSANGNVIDTLLFQGSQTLAGTGTVLLGGSFQNTLEAQGVNNDTMPATLTIGNGITIHGGAGTITGYFPADTVINGGTIDADAAGATITVGNNSTTPFINKGTLDANAGILNVGAHSGNPTFSPWVNNGTIALIGPGAINFDGNFAPSAIGTFSRPGDQGTVNVVGYLNNAGATLSLNAGTGTWNLAGGTIIGGTIAASGAAVLGILPPASTLSGVTVAAGTTLDATQTNVVLLITGGVTLNGTLDLGSAQNTSTVLFQGDQTLAGTGTVQCGAVTGFNQDVVIETQGVNGGPATLTIGSGITINGAARFASALAGQSYINQGTISVSSGQTAWIDGNWDNQGTVRATGGGDVRLHGNFTNEGTFDDPDGLIQLEGTLNNTGKNLTVDGTWFLYSGSITGGTVTTVGAGVLNAYHGDAGGSTLIGLTLAGKLVAGTAPFPGALVNISGGLTLKGGSITISSLGQLDFQGTQKLGGTGTASLTDVFDRFGMLVPTNGDVLTIGLGITIFGNSGQLGSQAGGSLINQGTIEAIGGGTLTVFGDADVTGGTLTGGTWEAVAGGTLRLLGDNVATNAATILLDGAGAHIYSDSAATDALTALATNAAGASLTIQNGANLTSSAALGDQGTLTVGSGSTLTVPSLTIATRATLSGSGTIGGSVVNGGQLSPGSLSATGALTIAGSYTQGSAGALNIAIGGITPGSQYAQLNVSGAASLGGALNVSLANGFGPSAEQVFKVLTFSYSSGGFAAVNMPTIGGSPAFMVGVTPTALNLVALTSAPDLAAGAVAFTSSQAQVGQNITVNYSVSNLGTVATTAGPWTDSIYLSAQTTLTPDATLLGRVTHTGVVGGLANYSGSLTAPLPGLPDGNYHVLLVADSGMQVLDVSRANNTGLSAALLHLATPLLTIGTPLSGTIGNGQDVLLRLNVTPGTNVQIQGTFAAADEAGFYVRYGTLPTTSSFDESSTSATDLNPLLVLPSGQGGPYYILLHGLAGAGPGKTFQLLASVVPFGISSFDTTSGSNQGGTVTMKVSGSGFTAQTAVTLHNGSTTIAAKSTTFINSNELIVTFDLTGQPTGNYSVHAADGSQSSDAAATFQVTADSATPELYPFMTLPGSGLPDEPATFVAGVVNHGKTDVQIPVFGLIGKNVAPVPEEIFFGGGTLAPGQAAEPLEPNFQTGKLVHLVKFTPYPDTVGTMSSWSLVTVPSSVPIDWAAQESSMRPASIAPDAWHAIFLNLTAALGQTVGDLEKVLQADSVYLAQLGEPVGDRNALLGFEVEKASDTAPTPILSGAVDSSLAEPGIPLTFGREFVQSLAGRNRPGILGYGWTSNWDISATIGNAGNVFIQEGPITRAFSLQGDASYLGSGGDPGTLTLANGSFSLREPDHTVTTFLPNGRLDYIQDSNGNSVTAGYTGSLLTALTHSDGDALALSYNSMGLLSEVVDPAGRVTTYTYDSNGQLIAASNSQGTYTYTYLNGQGIAQEHALASVRNPDGTHNFFGYDAQGRLIEQSRDNASSAVTYAYLSPGGYTMTDSAGATTTVLYEINGKPAFIKDPLGNIYRATYDADGRVTLISNPDGSAASVTYDGQGNPRIEVDPLGDTSRLVTDPQNGGLQTFQNANGDTTSLSYDSQGNLASVIQPDGTGVQYSYNAQGRVAQSTDALGRVTKYSYDNHGKLTRRDNPDGTYVTYSYDPHGNMIAVADASGTIALSYDAADRPIQITYPDGRFLKYSYDAAGRKAQVNQDGFIVDYSYDSSSRLQRITDGNGGLIASYSYDGLDRLQRQDSGNGTYTTYQYDAAGDLLHLVNFAPDGTVSSRFDYTYDDLGRRTSEATLAGTTAYGYDAAGRLTSVMLPGGRTITYAYDAAGNRKTVTDTGLVTTTDYQINDLNQYVSIGGANQTFDGIGDQTSGAGGGATYSYDDQGRLLSVTTGQDTWTYEYNALGSRTASTHNGVRTEYLVDPRGQVLAEFDASNHLVADYTQGIGLTSRVDSAGNPAYYTFDGSGNTAQLTGTGGTVLDSYSYLPFGEALTSQEAISNPFTFGGHVGVLHEGGGLFQMGARSYDPAQGRFVQPDPIGLAGGANLYAYVSNNPVNAVDPSGLAPFFITSSPEEIDALMGFLQGGPLPGVSNLASSVGPAEGVAVDALAPTVVGDAAATVGEVSPLAYEVSVPSIDLLATNITNLGLNYAQFAPQVDAAAQEAAGLSAGAYALLVADVAIWGFAFYEGYQLYKDLTVPTVTSSDSAPLISGTYTVVGPHDPNYITGPGGFGPQGFVQGAAPLPYVIGFENQPSATAPAHVVQVTQQLDSNLDWSTFQLGTFGFGGQSFGVPAGLSSYSTRIDKLKTLGVYVDANANFDQLTGQLTWTFTTIDPTTLDDPVGNVSEGFLPPNVTAPQGQGFVSYSVQPKSGDTTGTVLQAHATVTFDAGLPDQSPLQTPSISNAIDSGPPGSSVAALPPTEYTASFPVSWSGQDDAGGSGVNHYNVYVSTDGGPFALWLGNTTQTSAAYVGQEGQTYGFFSLAIDNVGNVQPTPAAAQASTKVTLIPGDADGDGKVDFTDLVILARNYGKTSANWATGDFNGDGKVDFSDLVILARNYGHALPASPAVSISSSPPDDPLAPALRRRRLR